MAWSKSLASGARDAIVPDRPGSHFGFYSLRDIYMKESQILGTLLPSHPDFHLIEKAFRKNIENKVGLVPGPVGQ